MPPYALICNDVADLARAVGLGRLAADGVQVASLLLSPAGPDPSGAKERVARLGPNSFEDVEQSLETARGLDFPWDVCACLSLFFRFLAGEPPNDREGQEDPDLSLAVQILALVWLRHGVLGESKGSPEDLVAGLKASLQKQDLLPASSEVLEAYARLLERRQGRTQAVTRKDVFIVRDRSEPVRPLIAHLRKDGYSIVEVKELPEALHLHERRRPDAIVVHYDDFPDEATKFSRFIRQESTTLLYALTARSQSSLIMNLLDAGFDDVFMPPFNYDLITAKMTKSLVAREQQSRGAGDQAGFRGTFRERQVDPSPDNERRCAAVFGFGGDPGPGRGAS